MGSAKGVGGKRLGWGNNIFSDHNNKDTVTNQVSEDGPSRICGKKSLLCGEKSIGGFNSAL